MTSLTIESHTVSNGLIALAHVTISIAIILNLAQISRPTRTLAELSALFMLFCGVGHGLDALHQTQALDGWHWITAIVSGISAIAFVIVLPRQLGHRAVLGTIIENIPISLGLLRAEHDKTGHRRLRWTLISNRVIIDLGDNPNGQWFDDQFWASSGLNQDDLLTVLDTSAPILKRELAIHHPLTDQQETYLFSCVSLPGNYLWILWQDITDLKAADCSLTEATAKLDWQSTHDQLTQAGNLALFEQLQIEEADRFFGLFAINLNRFKTINDTLGHHIGDVLLKNVATRIQALLNPGDVLVRTGADDFLVLLEKRHLGETLEETARQVCGATHRPFVCLDREIHIDVGIGIADSSAGNLALMRIAADIALQTAKSDLLGKRIVTWTQELMANVRERQAISLDLERALKCMNCDGTEFELYYQPIVRLDDPSQCYEVEALIRWTSPNLGVVSPGVFIPIAEQTGLIAHITDWVIHQAIVKASRWQNELRVAVNISPWDLERDGFVERIITLCDRYGVMPSRLALEITERAMTDNLESFTGMLQTLGRAGIRLKIDDFGTGDSGLGRILAGRWSEVKIDRSLLPLHARDFGRIAICRAITNLCNDLNIRTLAEGIETEEQRRLLAALNIQDAQGFFFAKPMTEQGLVAANWVTLAAEPEREVLSS